MSSYAATKALQLAASITDETERPVLISAIRDLASAYREMQQAVIAHRGVIVALADNGDEMVTRLDERWSV